MADSPNNPSQEVTQKSPENTQIQPLNTETTENPCQELLPDQSTESNAQIATESAKVIQNKPPEDGVEKEKEKLMSIPAKSQRVNTEQNTDTAKEISTEQIQNEIISTENVMKTETEDTPVDNQSTVTDTHSQANAAEVITEQSNIEPGDMDLVDQVIEGQASKDAANTNYQKVDINTSQESCKKGAEFMNSHYDESSQTTTTDSPVVNGVEECTEELDKSTEACAAASSLTEKDKPMSLDKIKSMIDTINSDIVTLKNSSDASQGANVTAESKSGEQGEIDFQSLRMRNDMLRQELLSIKKNQETRMHVDTASVAEMKIIESTKKNKLLDCTRSLEDEIKLINKAQRAQASLKKKQEERQQAELKRKRAEQDGVDNKPVSEADIRTSIKLLKDEMEKLSKFPVGEIVPDNPTGNESEKPPKEQSEAKTEAEQEKITKNKKAHDDMLKKYLMMNVMRQNVQTLTAKLNTIMTSQGIKPVTDEEARKSLEGKASDNVDGADDYFMYNDDDGDNSDLYEEDETTEPEVTEKSSSVLEAAAKSISKVEAVIYKDKESTDSTSTVSEIPKTELSKSQKKKLRKRQQVQGNVASNQPKSKPDITKSEKSKEENDIKEKDEEAVIPPERMRTYNLLLKLQREMASMHIQVSKLQDNMRAANTALRDIMETEFADV